MDLKDLPLFSFGDLNFHPVLVFFYGERMAYFTVGVWVFFFVCFVFLHVSIRTIVFLVCSAVKSVAVSNLPVSLDFFV